MQHQFIHNTGKNGRMRLLLFWTKFSKLKRIFPKPELQKSDNHSKYSLASHATNTADNRIKEINLYIMNFNQTQLVRKDATLEIIHVSYVCHVPATQSRWRARRGTNFPVEGVTIRYTANLQSTNRKTLSQSPVPKITSWHHREEPFLK